MNDFNKVAEELENQKQKLADLHKETFYNYVKFLLNKPDVYFIEGVGYTPGFNDGDPCTHSQHLGINGCEFEVTDSFEDTVNLAVGDLDWSDLPAGTREENTLLNDFGECLEDEFGTDWKVCFTLDENGEVKTEKLFYDCGY